jgi:hypothetical protein
MDVGCTNSQSSPLKDRSLGENQQIPEDVPDNPKRLGMDKQTLIVQGQ